MYRVADEEWPPFHTGFELFLIVLRKSDEKMPYWLGLGHSFARVVHCCDILGSGIMLENIKILFFKIYTN